ncbi:Thiol peroxidase, Bcp-type [Methylophaga thiooxydans]|uniref:thioredoxin-dependent peroxiredoxin n=1 Tax=Methylophaga thiooxydans TaxID=392484 RepID=A0A0A0BEN1_9GAMM|nr:peroxiredoxin [Methylophaga thiooxydans]KGM06305.1 Thiol peroxidase, Bcp-type [Methylophaga thiooxydans]
MTQVQLGQPVADFEVPSTGDKTFRLSEHKGKNILIYFYPKDNTPGCTLEGQNFRDDIAFFNDHNTLIVGVSRDSLRKHENFKTKQSFPFDLLSDEDESVCKLFDVIKLKKLYGREYMGIDRSTFLIDTNGVLRNEWRKVKVKQHLDEVKEAILAL